MITNYTPRMEAAIDAAKAGGTEVGSANIFDDLDKADNVNIEEYVWEEGDEFELPVSREAAAPFMCKDVYKNLPRKADGTYPVGYSVLVDVHNSMTGAVCIKRFRPNQLCKSVPEYKYDVAKGEYIATGKFIGPDNDFANEVRPARTLGARLDLCWGKKLKVARIIRVDTAIRQKGVVVGTTTKCLPEFVVVG